MRCGSISDVVKFRLKPLPSDTNSNSISAHHLQVIDAQQNANQPKPHTIYFWRPTELTTGYLSQWYTSHPFRDREDPAKIYATAEHYMMHQKALLFGDAEAAAAILEATSPRDVKALGRAVRGFDQAVWERERERIVREGSWCKFSLPVVDESEEGGEGKGKEGEEEELRAWSLGDGADAPTMRAASLRDVLLATGDRELVEASPFDRIWGVGFAAKNAPGRRNKWGMNLLGKCLMEVREEFRKEAEAKAEAARAEDGGGIVRGGCAVFIIYATDGDSARWTGQRVIVVNWIWPEQYRESITYRYSV
ncbi:hypothetical protein CIB48_g3183 [Xylaria polymorpha]|nr:hypothetical protein CIB48_g3183 [Xylaria polymorpha]